MVVVGLWEGVMEHWVAVIGRCRLVLVQERGRGLWLQALSGGQGPLKSWTLCDGLGEWVTGQGLV